jgi:hypothetical protein
MPVGVPCWLVGAVGQALNFALRSAPATEKRRADALKPGRYSEENASREVSFSEREVNALIAANADLAIRSRSISRPT